MTGPHDSVIGVQSDLAIKRMRTGLPVRFETAAGDVRIEGALVECDGNGRATLVHHCSRTRYELDAHPGSARRAGVRRPRLRLPRAHRAAARARRRGGRRARVPGGVVRGVGAEPARDVRGRRPRALLRPARPRRRRASLYVGRRWVHEDDAPLVVNWQAPAARPFYTATVAEPQGVTLRRRFRVDGRRLLDLYDEPLDGSAGDVVHGVADILLEELERSRDEHMRDIVATIQADQFALITREPEGVFIVQGGPGHGQDGGRPPPRVVAPLHVPPRARALGRARRRAEPGVHGLHLARAADARRGARRAACDRRARRRSRATRRDKPEVARRKADVAIARAARGGRARRLPSPPGELVGIRVDGAFLYLEPDDVAALIDEAQEPSAARTRSGATASACSRRGGCTSSTGASSTTSRSGRSTSSSARPARSSASSSTARGRASRPSSSCVACSPRRSSAAAAGARPTCRSSTRRARCSTGRRSSTGT